MFNFGMLGNLAQMYQQFQQNPMGMLNRRFNIPQNIRNPQDIVQYLLNTNQVSQNQVNEAIRQAKSQPQFKHFFDSKAE